MRKMREKTMLVLLVGILVTSFLGAFVGAEFPWTTSLTVKNSATSAWTTANVNTGFYSVHLKTTGTVGSGDEARFVVTLPSGITLGDIYTISWQEFLVAGYPPHVDILLDLNGDGIYTSGTDDALVFEYAYNIKALHEPDGQPTYGAITGGWYQTFSDDGDGPSVITNNAYCWLTTGPAGGTGIIGDDLYLWKLGLVPGDRGIDKNTPVLRLEFEVDNWMAQTEAYLDDVFINGLDIMGVSGPIGPQGPTGPQGPQGYIGPQGPQGDIGPAGATGDTGPQGIQGDTGATGLTGATGPRGLRGLTGAQGLQGEQGELGPLGPQGETGLNGSQGEQGLQGVAGEAGVQGLMGPAGLQGDTGEQGPKGDTGEQGPAGAKGDTGEQGEPAPTFPTVGLVGGTLALSSIVAAVISYVFKKRT